MVNSYVSICVQMWKYLSFTILPNDYGYCANINYANYNLLDFGVLFPLKHET